MLQFICIIPKSNFGVYIEKRSSGYWWWLLVVVIGSVYWGWSLVGLLGRMVPGREHEAATADATVTCGDDQNSKIQSYCIY